MKSKRVFSGFLSYRVFLFVLHFFRIFVSFLFSFLLEHIHCQFLQKDLIMDQLPEPESENIFILFLFVSVFE